MLRHKEIRIKQKLLKEQLNNKIINATKYVSEINNLEKELEIVEAKMYEDYNTENNSLTKDKIIANLKNEINTNFSQLNNELVPKSYLRISKRFPHLNLEEIIAFEQKVRDNGGSIQVHKGKFRLINRSDHQYTGYCAYKNISWDCCGHEKYLRRVTKPPLYQPLHPFYCLPENERRGREVPQNVHFIKTGDLENRDPTSECGSNLKDYICTFYLKEEDEKSQYIKNT